MENDDAPPELEQGDVPFEERPRRFARIKSRIRGFKREREKPLSLNAVAIFALVYFGGGLVVQRFDQGFLLFAWIMTGPLAITVYHTREVHGSLLNPYTLFFSTVLAASITAHFLLN